MHLLSNCHASCETKSFNLHVNCVAVVNLKPADDRGVKCD
jgi:hypothetical protein